MKQVLIRAAVWLYACLLRLYPQRFRHRYGGAMMEDFRKDLGTIAQDRGTLCLLLRAAKVLLADAAALVAVGVGQADGGNDRTMSRTHKQPKTPNLEPRRILDSFCSDLRFAFRSILRNKTVTFAALLILAAGIGAGAAIFSVVNTTLLRPLPFRDDHELARIYITRDHQPPMGSLHPPIFLEIMEHGGFFQGIVAQRYVNMTLTTQNSAVRLAGQGVTSNWLEVLGIRPHKGRGFTHDEEEEGLRSHVVLISHALWRNHFGGTDDALGQQMTLDGQDFTVVGVMPPGFTYPYANDLWFPLKLERESEGNWGLNVQARLGEGVTLERARQELEILAGRLRPDYPDILGDRTLTPVSTREVLLGEKGHQSVALLGAVGFVLLIVCINIACLLLARSVARRREMSIRSALGATRTRQMRQLLTESGLMASAGGALGLVLALWLSRFLRILVPGRMSNLLEAVPVDAWVVLFTLVLTIVAGLLFGALPSWVATRGGLEALRGGGRGQDGSSSSRLFNWMVTAEVALCLLLLTGAGLMLQNLQGLLSSDLGYDPRHLTVFSVTLGGDEYSHPQRRIQSVRQIEDRLRALPEIAEAGLTSMFPSHRGAVGASLEIEGKPMEPQDPQILAHSRLVSPGFFAAMNMRARRGRLLQPSDNSEAAPVALISHSLAQAHWPDSSPVGERIRSRRSEDGRWLTIVGVAPDLSEYFGIEHAWYRPYAQQADTPASEEVTFVVRTNSAAEGLQETLNGAVREVDRNLPVFDFTPVPELFRESLDQERLGTIFMGLFAVFGLLIAALGILGVTAYGVNRGRNELGIRLALGARPDQILGLVVKRTLRLAVWGIVIGIAGSLLVGKLLSGWLFSLSTPGLDVLAAVSLFLLAVTLAASYGPARWASKVDPLQALRLE